MKKIIACILTLCVLASIAMAGFSANSLTAAAETAEAEAPAVESAAEPATASEPEAPASVATATEAESASPDAAAETGAATDGETEGETGTEDGLTLADETSAQGDTGDEAAAEADETAESAQTDETGETAAATAQDDAQADGATQESDALGVPETLVPVAEAVVEPDVGSGPAWIPEGAHRHYGELTELLPIAMVNSLTVVLCTADVLSLSNYTEAELRGVSFGIDTVALGEEYCDGRSVVLSSISPSGQQQEGVLYIWVGHASDVPSTADTLAKSVQLVPEDAALLETEIMVQAQDYVADGDCAPSFTLTAYPTLGDGMVFAVLVDEGAAQAIEGNAFAPLASGTYRFAVLEADGTVAALSIPYTVCYAQAAPADAEAEPVLAEAAEAEPEAETTEETESLLTQADLVEVVALAATAVETVAPELTVRAYDYVEGTLSLVTPTFVLSGAPAESGYSYGVSINGGEMMGLPGDTYAQTDSGETTCVFYLLDETGAIADTSAAYAMVLDFSVALTTGEAWMEVSGAKLYGSLASLLRQADSGAVIYLLTTDVMAITNTAALESVTLLPDPDTFGAEYGVITSDTSPAGESAQGVTYVWLGVGMTMKTMAFATFGAATFTVDSVSIGSRALADGLWVNGSDALTFQVTDSNLTRTYSYEISLNGGATFIPFGNGATLGSLGVLVNGDNYILAFRMTATDDPFDTVTTGTYSVNYDNEAPILICKAGVDFTLSFYAGDAVSGFSTSENNVTFNATASPSSWVAQLTYQGQHVYTYSVRYASEGVIAAGTLGVRDQAGNVGVWGSDITISGGQSAGGGSAGGTGTTGATGGTGTATGTATRTVSHSASTYTAVTAYDGVDLVVETGAMRTLTIGDQTLDLTLMLDGAADAQPLFRADFTNWGGTATEETDADTLVLTAADGVADNGAYVWTFDGSVYKKLAASGIDYMVFTVGDEVAALSTAGFAGGIRYNMYRAAGLPSSAFVYQVRMGAGGVLQLSVTVQGETFALTNEQTSDFYYYDVYQGTSEMLNQPFGQQRVQSAAADGWQG